MFTRLRGRSSTRRASPDGGFPPAIPLKTESASRFTAASRCTQLSEAPAVNRLFLPSLRRRLSSQDGFALVLALGAMIALSAIGTSVVYFTTSNGNATTHVKNDQIALALAESGLAMANTRLDTASAPSIPNGAPAQTAPAGPLQAGGGRVQYSGPPDPANRRWTLTGVGTV